MKPRTDMTPDTMILDSAHTTAHTRLFDSESSQQRRSRQDQKRRRSQTLGTTFVSTTVLPAQSSADVLSSLISSLTLLSDTAREQIRSARELESTLSTQPNEQASRQLHSSYGVGSGFNGIVNLGNEVYDFSDGEEAEPPVVGYSRSRSKERKKTSLKEKWAIHGSTREKSIDLGGRRSSHTIRRPQSATSSSGIGVPSIERGFTGSSTSLSVVPSAGTKSPLKMLLSTRSVEDDSKSTSRHSHRGSDVRSIKSLKISRSKHTVKLSQDHGKENLAPVSNVVPRPQTPPQQKDKPSPHKKKYSPLNPANREDLSEHLIPSRNSSMRHSPILRRSSKGGSPNRGRNLSLQPKPVSRAGPVSNAPVFDEEPLEEEDSTLRRIRELQRAKEQRNLELRKESKATERSSSRWSRHRSKSGHQKPTDGTDLPLRAVEASHNSESSSKISPVVREIDVAVTSPYALPSPPLSTPRKHKRSLSAGLRRSNSSKGRPVDDIRSVSEQVETFLTAPRLTQRIRHPRTGRTIAFSEVGDPHGFVVFCCVGMGLTRYITSFYDDVARTQKLRLITPDRPGIGESSPFPDNVCTPLAWVDDVTIICQTLEIEKFSLLAHSAGSMYALAIALKMPERIRGRIHLLAPWIPPSQLSGTSNGEIKAANLPIAHKLLSVLPAPLLKAANSRFLSSATASIEPRTKSRRKDTYDTLLAEVSADMQSGTMTTGLLNNTRNSSFSHYITPATTPTPYSNNSGIATSSPNSPSPTNNKRNMSVSATKLCGPLPNEAMTPQQRQALLNSELAHRTWALATHNANPSVDLIICLERRRPIGFRYTDVTRGVVIHHGRKDARVPLDNAVWLSKVMKRGELRVLENEGHGLMSSANVMSKVLSEIGHEWEEWVAVAKDNEKRKRNEDLGQENMKETDHSRLI